MARISATLPMLSRTELEVERHVFEIKFAGFDLREVEDVVDNAQQRLCRIFDLGQVIALFGRQLGGECEMREADDAVHRRADFVAHVGEKFALCLRRAQRFFEWRRALLL